MKSYYDKPNKSFINIDLKKENVLSLEELFMFSIISIFNMIITIISVNIYVDKLKFNFDIITILGGLIIMFGMINFAYNYMMWNTKIQSYAIKVLLINMILLFLSLLTSLLYMV